jgi:phosphoenolpyruvate carboxykinase (ATP)
VGRRMDIPYTRAMVDAAVEGTLSKAEFEIEPTFGFAIPRNVQGVPTQLLNPRNSWADKDAYDRMAADLRNRFAKNFANFDAPPEVKAAGPHPLK